jgi:hypothetical protein
MVFHAQRTKKPFTLYFSHTGLRFGRCGARGLFLAAWVGCIALDD